MRRMMSYKLHPPPWLRAGQEPFLSSMRTAEGGGLSPEARDARQQQAPSAISA
jgi:hypothetical protein